MLKRKRNISEAEHCPLFGLLSKVNSILLSLLRAQGYLDLLRIVFLIVKDFMGRIQTKEGFVTFSHSASQTTDL